MDFQGNGVCRLPGQVALRPEKKVRRKILFPLLLAGLLGLSSLFLGEILLRIFWQNPHCYAWNDFSGYVRLQRPNQKETYDITGLYEGAGKIRFRTGPLGEILGSGVAGTSWAIGGSTTECRYVPEDLRWPDRVGHQRLTNFGSSGCALGDSFFNVRFLLEHKQPAPSQIFLMHAVNDLSSWKDYLESRGDPQAWARLRLRFHTTARDNRALWGRSVWLIAWYASIRDRYPLRNFGAWSARDFYVRLRAKSVAGRAQSPLGPQEFERFYRGPFEDFLRFREKTFLDFQGLLSPTGTELVLLTQPHAFRPDYHPFDGIDLRDTPELIGGFASYEQTARLLQAINQQTRAWSQRHGIPLVDLEREMENDPPSPLFYDSVHYTLKGSEKVASLINQKLRAR